jgi:hypothetical protein
MKKFDLVKKPQQLLRFNLAEALVKLIGSGSGNLRSRYVLIDHNFL